MIENCPEDAWARRELALHLANHGRTDEALESLEIGRRLERDSPSYFYTLGHVYHKADRIGESVATYEEAIRRSVDNDVAITELIGMARGKEERDETMHFIASEFAQQESFGDGLLTFRDQAAVHMEPDDLYRILDNLLEDHREIWQCWSTCIQQLLACERNEEAHELAKEAVIRFPLLARLWADLADVCKEIHEPEGQIEVLRRAVEIAPGWSYAARELAEALESNDQGEEGRVVLEQAVARAPLDPVNHGYLADAWWNGGEGDEALKRVEIALKMDPGYDWAWRALAEWSEKLEKPGLALEKVRDITQTRPGDPRLAGPGPNAYAYPES